MTTRLFPSFPPSSATHWILFYAAGILSPVNGKTRVVLLTTVQVFGSVAMTVGIRGTGNHLMFVPKDVIALPCLGTSSGSYKLRVLTEWSGTLIGPHTVNIVITNK